jgi:hypothetical protein
LMGLLLMGGYLGYLLWRIGRRWHV